LVVSLVDWMDDLEQLTVEKRVAASAELKVVD
jgi:hypothetical protein